MVRGKLACAFASLVVRLSMPTPCQALLRFVPRLRARQSDNVRTKKTSATRTFESFIIQMRRTGFFRNNREATQKKYLEGTAWSYHAEKRRRNCRAADGNDRRRFCRRDATLPRQLWKVIPALEFAEIVCEVYMEGIAKDDSISPKISDSADSEFLARNSCDAVL